MNALDIVYNLLEDDGVDMPPEDTPEMSRDLYAGDDGQLLIGLLRDELVERGWRRIRINRDDDGTWTVTAGYIDAPYRAYWELSGARVAPCPEDRLPLRGRIGRTFQAACGRAKIKGEGRIENLVPVHPDGYDLHTAYADIEDDPGDWEVTLVMAWVPLPGFFSKASGALGYENRPNQRAAKPPPEPRSPARSLLTPEQQDAADERHRITMGDLKQRAMKSSKEFDANLARWKREGGREIPPYLL